MAITGALQIDTLAIFFFFVLVFWQPLSFRSGGTWYEELKKKIWLPPNWIFPVVWFILFSLISVGIFLYWNQPDKADKGIWIAIFSLFAANLIANKIWYPVFFQWKMFGVAFFLAIFLLLTDVAIVILLAVENSWISFAFFIAYGLWLVFASYLSGRVWYYYSYTSSTPTTSGGIELSRKTKHNKKNRG